MSFTDLSVFGPFLGVVLLLAFWVRRRQPQQWALLLASAVFCALGGPFALPVLLAVGGLTFAVGRRLARPCDSPRARRGWLTVGVAGALGVLAVFKYTDFLRFSVAALVTGLVRALGAPDFTWTPAPLGLPLPLGVSFYSFQAVAYLVDVYRGTAAPLTSGREFALYLLFFPRLVAGPIVRPGEFATQLQRPAEVSARTLGLGLPLLAAGLLKKAVFAGHLAPFVDGIYATQSAPASLLAIAACAYSLQIYCDFSGYTDLARGTAGLLGYHLPENFRHPYRSVNPQEFWRRWHITLSAWLRDYLYIPLGGSRCSSLRRDANLALTMGLGGLWHGAAWNFVLWGLFHGLWLVGHRHFGRLVAWAPRLSGLLASPPGTLLRGAATFYLVTLGWILFRVTDLHRLVEVAGSFLRPDRWFTTAREGLLLFGTLKLNPRELLLTVVVFAAVHLLSARVGGLAGWLSAQRPAVRALGLAVAALVLLLFWPATTPPFIYAQF